MKSTPFFSICIPTFNRAEDIQYAIKRILSQTFKDFEIVIVDNDSKDNTREVVDSFKDKRIKYYKNERNIGGVKNTEKAMRLAEGKYIFLHGDDDYLLYDNVLSNSHKKISGNKLGLLRLNYLYQTFDKRNVFDYYRHKSANSNLFIKPHGDPQEILDFIEKIDLFFLTGIIFKNPSKIKIIDSEFMLWFSLCYKNILDFGGYYDSNYQIIASWSYQANNQIFFVKNGKLSFEPLYDEIRKISGESYYSRALNKQLQASVSFLASIKYNSSNENLLNYAKRILELDPGYKFSLKFWIILVVSFFSPKSFLRLVRRAYIKKTSMKGTSIKHLKILEQMKKISKN